jgi:hypothetical protein
MLSTAFAADGRETDLPVDLAAAAEDSITVFSVRHRERRGIDEDWPKFSSEPFEKAKLQAQDAAQVPTAFATLAEATKVAIEAFADAAQSRLASAAEYLRIQDEELEILWWLTSGRSWDLNQPFQQVSVHARALVAAKELADRCGRVPGPPALLALLSRMGVDASAGTIVDAVNACSLDWLKTVSVEGYEPSPLTQPIHLAVERRLETGDEESWIAGWAATTALNRATTLPALEIAKLFFRERLVRRATEA